MLPPWLRRGLAAGLLAGLVAGIFALVAGEPPLEAAIALEDAARDTAPGGGAATRDAPEIGRVEQRVGLVIGTTVLGVAIGAFFGLVSRWGGRRLHGNAWTRALKLAAVAVAALVLLPALAYPPNPPGLGDPGTVTLRTNLHLGVALCGVLLALAARAAARQLGAWAAPPRQAVVGAGVVVVAMALLALLPEVGTAGELPPETLWAFRLASIGTQALLYGGTGVAYGLLTWRAETRGAAPAPDG